MSSSKPPQIVPPLEFKERTSLMLTRSREGSTAELDIAYERWYKAKYDSEQAKKLEYKQFVDNKISQADLSTIERYRGFLQDKLEKYLEEHGGRWDRCKRNTSSNGLLKFIHDTVKVEDPRVVKVRGLVATDNEHSRYGVLYLLGNIDINMDRLGIVLEGVGEVGGALATGIGTDYGELKNPDGADISIAGSKVWNGDAADFLMGDEDMSIADAYGYASDAATGTAAKAYEWHTAPPAKKAYDKTGMRPSLVRRNAVHVQMSVGSKGPPASVANMNYLRMSRGTKVANSPAPGQDRGWFPTTSKALAAMGDHPTAASAFLPVAGAVIAGAVVVDLMQKLLDVLYSLVTKFVDWLKGKLQEFADNPIEVGAEVIKKIVMKVVNEVAAAAVPFVSAGFDLAQGLYQTFQAIRMKVGGWLERRNIRITEGHPALLASRIEKCMSMDIMSGLWTLIKGAVQTALAFLAVGAQSLISALTAGVEWCIKFVMRLIEQSAINSFLKLAKTTYEAEKAIRDAERLRTGAEMHATGGIINDLERFKVFFQKGCSASPMIAMLTINTGICGSQWQLQQVMGDLEEIGTKEFATGTEYFTRLKDYGTNYLKDSGFEFNASHTVMEEKQFLQALLDNAKNPKKAPAPRDIPLRVA